MGAVAGIFDAPRGRERASQYRRQGADMSTQPGQNPLLPAVAVGLEGEDDERPDRTDGGVPVGAADVEADRRNADDDADGAADGETTDLA
jgi:hypothetical protein